MRKALGYGLLMLASLLAGAWLACPGGDCTTGAPLFALDQAVLTAAQARQGGFMDSAMGAVTWLGSLWLLLPAVLLVGRYLWRTGRRREAMFLGASLLGASLLGHVAKFAVARPRPALFPMLVDLPPDWSYPSAHTMQAVAVALAVLLVRKGRPGGTWVVAGLVVALVGWSRIHLQVHFPSDVLFGGLAAIFWVLGLHAWLHRRTRSEPGIPGKEAGS